MTRCEWCYGPWHLCYCTGPMVTCEGCGGTWPVHDASEEPFGYSVDACSSCDEPPAPGPCPECSGRGVEPDSAFSSQGVWYPPDPCSYCASTPRV